MARSVIKQDSRCVEIKDSNGTLYIFKPYPPYSISYGNVIHCFDNADDIRKCYFALEKLMEFIQ